MPSFLSGDTDRWAALDIKLIRKTLLDIAADESPDRPHQAIQALAMALLHVAENIEQMRATLEEMKCGLARLSSLPETSQNVAAPRRPTPARKGSKRRGKKRVR